jgi:hypothetical protein
MPDPTRSSSRPRRCPASRALPPVTLLLDGEVAIFDDQFFRFEWVRKWPEDVVLDSSYSP